MNTRDSFDDLVAERLRGAAPREAPDRLLDATLVRITATSQRGGWSGWLGSPVGRVLAAAAVVAVAVVAGSQLAGIVGPPVGGDPSASPSAPASVEPSPEPSPTPVAGGPGETLLSFVQRCDVLPPVVGPATTVLPDGRVIWYRLNDDDSSTLSVRRLNEVGLAQVRDTIEATGLMTADAGFRLELRPGAQPPGHGFCTWDFQWEGGSEPVHVRSDMWLGDEEESTYYQPAPERETLDGLARRLQDPESWIEASGWADPEAVPYAPIGYLVMTTVLPPQLAVAGAPDVDTLSWPFPGAPGAFAEGPTLPDSESRCMEANAAEVEALAAQLAAAGLEQFVDPTGGSNVTLPWASRGASLDLYFYPQHPDGEPPCGGSATDPPS